MIDCTSFKFTPAEYLKFEELCNKIYDFVANEECANLFKLKKEFPLEEYPLFETAVEILLENHCLENGSKGFNVNDRPMFKKDQESNQQMSFDDQQAQINLERRKYIEIIESRALDILSDEKFYAPAHSVERYIENLNRSTTKTILEKYFIDGIDTQELKKSYSKVEQTVEEFSTEFAVDQIDEGFFERYNLPSNVFVYLFNRAPAYWYLVNRRKNLGVEDVTTLIFPAVQDKLMRIHRTPNSENFIDLASRLRSYLHQYLKNYGSDAKTFVAALLALLNNTSLKKKRAIELYEQYCIENAINRCPQIKWEDIFQDYIETTDRVKCLSYDNVIAISNILSNINGIDYAISVERAYTIREDEFEKRYIDNAQELREYILKYTTYKISEGRILTGKSLEESIQRYIRDVQIYNSERLIKSYAKSYGGTTMAICAILKSVDKGQVPNDNPLTPDEKTKLESKFSKYEWISKNNAKSIFVDLFKIENKFTELNMYELGFTNVQDAYYRHKKYSSFSDCLLKTEFVEDDRYIDDNRKFKLNMECRAYSITIESYESNLHWIPISECKYINLRSPKYEKFAKLLKCYKEKIMGLCKKQFMTAFSLKNTPIGIPEIDDDYYSLEFYEAMLIASKAKHQTLSKTRFFFSPSESTIFESSAPEFIRYIIYNNGGTASIDEIQEILKNEYGIISKGSDIKANLNRSSCEFSESTNTAYLDADIYMEALKNGTG